MKVLFTLLSIFSIFITVLAQEPGLPTHPMTAKWSKTYKPE
ncbi:MAG TPA: hypothetical protein VLB50_11960 [Ignavibacteriaceae bacterium]|nr:hypothetical protein [Ignavibacteriaceae bacterium]